MFYDEEIMQFQKDGARPLHRNLFSNNAGDVDVEISSISESSNTLVKLTDNVNWVNTFNSQNTAEYIEKPEVITESLIEYITDEGIPGAGAINRIKHYVRNGRVIKTFVCGTCGREFKHHYTLMRHIPTHTDERKFSCNICYKGFRQLSTLNQHKATHSEARPHKCQACGKAFNRISTLIAHRKIHSDEKLFACPVCSKAFHQKGNLRNHIFTHTDARPYQCDICYKGFNQKSNLVCHKKKIHKNGDINNYTMIVSCMDTQRNDEQAQVLKDEETEKSTTTILKQMSAKNWSYQLPFAEVQLSEAASSNIKLHPISESVEEKIQVNTPVSIIAMEIKSEPPINTNEEQARDYSYNEGPRAITFAPRFVNNFNTISVLEAANASDTRKCDPVFNNFIKSELTSFLTIPEVSNEECSGFGSFDPTEYVAL